MSRAVQHGSDLAAEEVSGGGVRAVDIRGTRLRPAVTPVLADPSGLRARRLARAGRTIAFLCLLWLVGLGLAGIGILPAADLPLGGVIVGGASRAHPAAQRPAQSRFDPVRARATSGGAVSAAAERVVRIRARAAPSAPDVRHRTSRRESVSSAVGRSRARSTARGAEPALPGSASGVPGAGAASETVAGPSGATSGPSQAAAAGASNQGTHTTGRGIATAPGTTVKATTLGHTGATARGNSGTAPGQVRPTAATVTTLPARSASSPGQTMRSGSGHGSGT